MIRLFYPVVWAVEGSFTAKMLVVTLPSYTIILYMLGTVGVKLWFGYETDPGLWWAALLIALAYFMFTFGLVNIFQQKVVAPKIFNKEETSLR